jgi:hypothetical protein
MAQPVQVTFPVWDVLLLLSFHYCFCHVLPPNKQKTPLPNIGAMAFAIPPNFSPGS